MTVTAVEVPECSPAPPASSAHAWRPFPFELKRFTVDEYHGLVAADLFKDDRVELLEGWIVCQMTHNPLHDVTVDRVHEAVRDRVSRDWRVRVQSAITLSVSEPEPDVAVAIGPAERYLSRHPGPADLALVIEVADTSLDRDREGKGPSYARAGIAVYWIVNLPERVVEVYELSGPAPVDAYPQPRRYTPGESVPLTVGGQVLPPIPVNDLLP